MDDFILVIVALISLSVTKLKDVINRGSLIGRSQIVVESVTKILDLIVSSGAEAELVLAGHGLNE